MALGKALHHAGYRNVMSRRPLHIATGGLSLRAFLPVYRRWMMFSRNGLPLSFTWRQWMTGVTFYGSLLLAALAWSLGSWRAALPSLAALLLVGVSQLQLQRRYGGAPMPLRLAWTSWAVFLLAPAIMATNRWRRDVSWRGRVYDLNAAAALAGGATELAGGARELAGGARDSASGATELAGGARELAGGARELAGGARELAGGARELAGGATELAGGARELAGGATELAGGAREIVGGDEPTWPIAGRPAQPQASHSQVA